MRLSGVFILGMALSTASLADDVMGVSSQDIADLGGRLEVLGNEVVLTLPDKLKFDFDSDAISDTSSPAVLAAFLLSSDVPLLLTIEGHADEVGTNKYNYALSKSRGNALKSELLSFGVEADSIAVIPRSESMPIDASGKRSAANRRLELTISYR
jgi:peptidoglycan-associated lipoprotein